MYNSSGSIPKVSVIVPCRNEKGRIEKCIRSILLQECQVNDLEVIVVDGMSDDGTREILMSLRTEAPCLRILDNLAYITPRALNIGIQASRGQYIAILGAHAEYAENYLQTCLALLQEHPEAICSGGPIISRGQGLFGRAVAAAMCHPIGVGDANHRRPNYEGYAEGACFPMFRREVFEKVGFYDETLIRNQDDEFNYRVACAGGKIFLSPRAGCTYFVREKPSQLFRQYFEYGFWRLAVLRKHHRPAAVRQMVPPVFMLIMITAPLLSVLQPALWPTAAVLPGIYGAVMLGGAMHIACRYGWRVGLLFSVAGMIMHVAYGSGFVWGVMKGINPPKQGPVVASTFI
jgi:glycosyltransferase involved in cell wall biosynthesis